MLLTNVTDTYAELVNVLIILILGNCMWNITFHSAGSSENGTEVTSYSMKQRVLKMGRMLESMATDGARTNMAPPCVSAEFP